MQKIPVTFTHDSKEYKGTLDEVAGAAGSTWHLMIDNYYCGKLIHTDKWIFHPNPKNDWMKGKGEEFGEVVTAWYQ